MGARQERQQEEVGMRAAKGVRSEEEEAGCTLGTASSPGMGEFSLFSAVKNRV